ncbi:MAG: heavy-metal-associated domain-containing protein [candidate division Zixibacteria bacterium]|nr:heavy-metal-associated domain-containing protein [candidate division Zixibacteria bacterium]
MKRLPIMLLVVIMLMAFTTAQTADTPASVSTKPAVVTVDAGHIGHMTPEECAKLCGITPEQCAKRCAGHQNCCVTRISVKGMTCSGCEKTISAALAGFDGVLRVVNVDHEKGMAVVCIDSTKVTDADMIATIVNKGYQAKIIPAVAKSADGAKASRVTGLAPQCGPEAAKVCAASKKTGCNSKKSGCAGSKGKTITGGKAPE